MPEGGSGFFDQHREIITSTVKLDPALRYDFQGGLERTGVEFEWNLTERLMQSVAAAELEAPYMPPGMNQGLMEDTLQQMTQDMSHGVRSRIYHKKPPDQFVRELKKDPSNNPFSSSYAMLGFFCVGMATRYRGAIDALAEAARLQGIQPQEMIQRHLEIIEYIKTEFPGLNETRNMTIGGRIPKPIDDGLKEFGFYWNNGSGHYEQS